MKKEQGGLENTGDGFKTITFLIQFDNNPLQFSHMSCSSEAEHGMTLDLSSIKSTSIKVYKNNGVCYWSVSGY